jgi:ribosomal protein L37E
MSNVWQSNHKIFMQRCPKCGRENWAPAVANGICAWCGYVATTKDIEEIILSDEATNKLRKYDA